MITILKALIVILSIASMATFAEPHVHGKAEAQVVVMGDQVSIQVTIPGNSSVGFEHQPITTVQKNQVVQVIQTLRSMDVISFFASSWRKKKKVSLVLVNAMVSFTSSNNQEPESSTTEDSHHHDHHNVPISSEHMEFVIKQEWQIQSGDALEFAFTPMFDIFPLLEDVHIDLVIGNNQTHAILTRSEPMARLK